MVLKVAVIGGGSSGLVTLKHLLQAHNFFPGVGIEAQLFEKKDDIGGVFSYQVYEDAELVSSKYLTAFSDFRISKDSPDFVTPAQYVDYLRAYAANFGLWKHIHCETEVDSIKPQSKEGGGGHVLKLRNARTGEDKGVYHCHAIAVCSGLNQAPLIPEIPGLTTGVGTSPMTSKEAEDEDEDEDEDEKEAEDNGLKEKEKDHYYMPLHPKIKTIHAASFKSRTQFGKGKTVLILGVGETAMDIAHLAVTSPTKRVIMCHRDGFLHAPKIVPTPIRAGGRGGSAFDPNNPIKPLDCCSASLFDTAYVPPIIQRGPLLWEVYDMFIKNMGWMISGTRAGFDQWIGGVGGKRFHVDSILICKSDRAMPYISEQWRSKSKFNQWRTWLLNMELKPTGGRKIDLAPWPSHVDDDGVVFFEKSDRPESKKMEMEKHVKPEIIVFATGYKQSFPFMNKAYPTLDDAAFRGTYRNIEDGVVYIGFVRPAFGAIPPLAELQAQHWIYHLLASDMAKDHTAVCPINITPYRTDAVHRYELDYKMKCRDEKHNFAQSKRAVDQDSYAYQLAVDMGAAPTWYHVLRKYGTEVFFTWAMGPNFPTKFRLVGPWSSPEVGERAARLMRKDGELGKVVRRTGGGVFFFTYTIIPLLIFAPLSVFINCLIWIWEGLVVRGSSHLRFHH